MRAAEEGEGELAEGVSAEHRCARYLTGEERESRNARTETKMIKNVRVQEVADVQKTAQPAVH